MDRKQQLVEELVKYNPVPFVTTDEHIDCRPCNNCGRWMVGVKYILRRDLLRYGKGAGLPKCEMCNKPCCPDCFRANPRVSYYCKDKCMELATQEFVTSHLNHKAWLETHETHFTYSTDTVSKRHYVTVEIVDKNPKSWFTGTPWESNQE